MRFAFGGRINATRKSPQQACEEAVKRIYKNFVNQNRNVKDTQIGFIAINKFGETGAFCLQKVFQLRGSLKQRFFQESNVLIDAKSFEKYFEN